MKSLIVLIGLCLTAAAQAQSKAIVIPFHDVHGRMMVDTKINGRAVRLLVDTGSQFSVDLRRYRKISPVIRSNSLEFEASQGEPLNVLMAQPEEKFDGIIGVDTVRHYKSVRIDYRKHVIELGD